MQNHYWISLLTKWNFLICYVALWGDTPYFLLGIVTGRESVKKHWIRTWREINGCGWQPMATDAILANEPRDCIEFQVFIALFPLCQGFYCSVPLWRDSPTPTRFAPTMGLNHDSSWLSPVDWAKCVGGADWMEPVLRRFLLSMYRVLLWCATFGTLPS